MSSWQECSFSFGFHRHAYDPLRRLAEHCSHPWTLSFSFPLGATQGINRYRGCGFIKDAAGPWEFAACAETLMSLVRALERMEKPPRRAEGTGQELLPCSKWPCWLEVRAPWKSKGNGQETVVWKHCSFHILACQAGFSSFKKWHFYSKQRYLFG